MAVYNVVFVQNEIGSCKKIADGAGVSAIKSHHYRHESGSMIYAIIKEENEANAHSVALNLLKGMRSSNGTRDVYAQ